MIWMETRVGYTITTHRPSQILTYAHKQYQETISSLSQLSLNKTQYCSCSTINNIGFKKYRTKATAQNNINIELKKMTQYSCHQNASNKAKHSVNWCVCSNTLQTLSLHWYHQHSNNSKAKTTKISFNLTPTVQLTHFKIKIRLS